MTDARSRPIGGTGREAPIPAPPRAEVRPTRLSAHGFAWADDYAWIRADNWREVLRDPSELPRDIRALLEAENAYADALLAPTLALQKELKREMRARLKEDDSEPPQVDGPWAYYSRFRHGGQHRIYCRKPREGGAETVLIDGDARAEGKAFFQLAGARHSPDHSKFAWSSDDLGSENSHHRGSRHQPRRGSRRPCGQCDRRHRLDARFQRLFLRRAGREPSSLPGDAASARDPARRRRRGLSGGGPRLVHQYRADAARPLGAHRRARARRFRDACRRSRLACRKAAPRRAAAAGPLLRRDGSRRRLLYPRQRRGAGFQDRRRAAREPGRSSLARRRPASLRMLHRRRDAVQGPSRRAGARGEPPTPFGVRPEERRGA